MTKVEETCAGEESSFQVGAMGLPSNMGLGLVQPVQTPVGSMLSGTPTRMVLRRVEVTFAGYLGAL